MLSVMLTLVSAETFTNPLNNDDISGVVDVEWENGGGTPGLFLQSAYGTCSSPGTWGNLYYAEEPDEVSYLWNTPEVDGDYCLRLQIDSTTYNSIDVFVDNTEPDAEFTVTTDVEDRVIFETIAFDAGGSSDTGGSGIANYTWDFDDGETETNAVSTTTHEYLEARTYDVILTVTDNVGNVGTYEDKVVIEDIETENEGEPFEYEAGILGITGPVLNENFDSGFTTLTDCSIVPSSDDIDDVDISISGNDCTIIENPNIPYDERGVHEIVIKATDGITIKYYDVTITVYTWWMPLTKGWNLISIPMMPEDANYKEVLDGIRENLDEVWTYAYDNGEEKNIWHKRATTSTGWSTLNSNNKGNLDKVVPGQGYFLKMDEIDTLKGFGSITPEIGGPLLGVEVTNGWNLIGHYGLNSLNVPIALSSLIVGLTDYYNAVVKSTSQMEKYVGYWMTGKGIETSMSYTPSQDAIDSI